MEECFTGGVTAAGRTGTLGATNGTFQIKWEEDYILRKAIALTYRYGRPMDNEIILNGVSVPLNMSSQIGDEQPDGPFVELFAVNGIDITDLVEITDNSISVFLDGFDDTIPVNTGWWSVMCVFLYESPTVDQPMCLRVYTADRTQYAPQEYSFATPLFDNDKDFGFSLYSDRVGADESDRSIVGINSEFLGNIGGSDATNPMSGFNDGGVRGHFYYENGELFGLDDDVPNNTVDESDGIAVINGYLVSDVQQDLYLSALSYPINFGRFNPHPAFFLTYTPDCTDLPDLGSLQRAYDFCRGDTIQLTTTTEYDTHSWSTSTGISDSTLSNPLCFADSSQWYTVTMWNEGEEGCSQTIPIFVEVNAIPRPASLNVNPSSCPDPTGLIQANSPAGRSPFTYRLDGAVQSNNASAGLSPGTYKYRINSAAGCRWDTTVTVPLDPLQEASFDPFPTTGFSPLFVGFANTSTNATGYQWLIDGVPISTSEDMSYTFPDSGSFEVSLIAYRLEESCADTATFTLRVEPGIQVLMPNIITPNSDGRNDALIAQVQGVASCRWVIYNRWGNEVASGSDGAPFQKVELWKPSSDVAAGQYSVVFISEGLAGQVEKMVFEFTLTK
ncbi:gliding motility-associated C-terminal domain-containing protein [Cryomorphaceae bacterium 1068]|nr:gliding motility-associated C-terminal domain-containing protein [Cryomorphaceae bacterium 1068]